MDSFRKFQMALKFVWDLIKSLTVEPVISLNFMSFQIFAIAQQAGLYEVICYQTFTDNSVDCRNLTSDQDAESVVQEKMTDWNMYIVLSHLLPTLFAHVIMGAVGDKYGRKNNILIGLYGLIMHFYPFLIIFGIPSTPLWILVITGFVAGATGLMGVIFMSSFAYLADVVHNREDLTVRMVILSLVMSMSSVVGSLVAALCTTYLEYSYSILVSLILLTISFFYSILRLKQIPPSMLRKRVAEDMFSDTEDLISVSASNERSNNGKLAGLKVHVASAFKMIKEVYLTYAKPRGFNRRIYLLMMAIIFFIQIMSSMSTSITSLYVFRSPLSWNASQLAYFRAASSGVNLTGNIFGVILFKKLFKLRETTIILIALACHAVQELLMGMARSTWMIYLAAGVGTLYPLFMPTVKSFIAQMVDHDEVGKAFVMFGLAHDVGGTVSSVASNTIYKATVNFLPGFIFFLCSGLLLIDFILVCFIHTDIVRREKKELKEIESVINNNTPNPLL